VSGLLNFFPTSDTAKVDVVATANALRDAYAQFYTIEKERIERRKKDLATLKKRANIKDSSTPATVSSILPYIYK
jgi:hypothetical protein